VNNKLIIYFSIFKISFLLGNTIPFSVIMPVINFAGVTSKAGFMA